MWINKNKKNLIEKYPELQIKLDANKKTIYLVKIKVQIYYGYNPNQLYEQLWKIVLDDVDKWYSKLNPSDKKNNIEKYLKIEDQAFMHRLIIDNMDDKFDKELFEEIYKTKIEFFKKSEIKH